MGSVAPLGLSAYDPGTAAAVEGHVRRLLGVPPQVPVAWRDLTPQSISEMRLEVEVGDGPGGLLLRLGAPRPGRARWQGKHLRLDLPNDDASHRALADALVKRLQAVDDSQAHHIAALEQAWRAHRAWLAVGQGEYATLGPHELLLRLTFRCNQDCSFCWQDRQWEAPPLPQLQRWVDEAHAAGVRWVLFSGGEPTLSPHLAPLLAYARGLGLPAGIQTNAIQMAKPHIRAALREAGLGFAIVSYHASDPRLSDALTQAPGTHARTEAGILAMLDDGLPVNLNMLIERRNLGHLVTTAGHIAGHFAPRVQSGRQLAVSLLHPNAYLDRGQWLQTMAPLDEVEPLLAEAIRLLLQGGVAVTATGACGYPLCALRQVPEVIPVQGKAMVAAANLTARTEASACQACALRGLCVGPRRTYLEQFGERGLVPFGEVPASLGVAARHAAMVDGALEVAPVGVGPLAGAATT